MFRVALVVVLLVLASTAAARRPRVLVYADAASSPPGVDALARVSRLRAELAALGARVVATEAWPGRLRNFDVLILLSPGHFGAPTAGGFTSSQVADVVSLTCRGGRIIIVSDLGQAPQHRVVNALLRDLIVGIQVTDERLPSDRANELALSPLTVGLDRMDGRGVARLTVSGTAMPLAPSPSGTSFARDVAPRCAGMRGAGDVIVLGDLDVIDDAAAERPGNALRWRTLLRNLVSIRSEGLTPARNGARVRRQH